MALNFEFFGRMSAFSKFRRKLEDLSPPANLLRIGPVSRCSGKLY